MHTTSASSLCHSAMQLILHLIDISMKIKLNEEPRANSKSHWSTLWIPCLHQFNLLVYHIFKIHSSSSQLLGTTVGRDLCKTLGECREGSHGPCFLGYVPISTTAIVSRQLWTPPTWVMWRASPEFTSVKFCVYRLISTMKTIAHNYRTRSEPRSRGKFLIVKI